MMRPDRQMLWAVAWAVDLLFAILAFVASNWFLGAGAAIYGLLLIVFLLSEGRPGDGE